MKVTPLISSLFLDSGMMGSEDMEGMVYQDEDGNLIMVDHNQLMGSEDEEGHEMMGESYGMEGSHEEVRITQNQKI